MKPGLLIAVLAAAALVASCQRAEPPGITESIQTGSDVPAVTAAPAAATPGAVSAQDVEFVRTALAEGMGEVELATAVRSHTRNADVKRLANDVIDDFNRIDAELANFADARSLSVPGGVAPQLDDARRNVLSDGHDLDEGYVNALLRTYGDLVGRYTAAAQNASDGGLRNIAGNAAPILQEHRARAEAIRENLTATRG